MATLTSQEVYAKIEVLKTCWEYLRDNFHKFNDTNKIKIAIALATKDLPTKLEGDVKGPTQIVVVRSKDTIADTTEVVPRQVPV